MSDILRLVRLSPGGRPIVVRDLENGSTYAKTKDSLDIAPGDRKQQQAGAPRRYAGSRATGENQENATLTWTALVSGANVADQTCANADNVIADFEAWSIGLLVEFRPDGASRSTFYDVRGPAKWKPKYSWAQMAGARSIEVEFQAPIAVLALLAPCDILDDFSVNTFGTIGIGAGTYQATILADSPALYWRLGETVGTTAADTSGNSRTGTYAGVTLNQTGLLTGDADKCIDVNGGTVTSTYSALWAGNWTVEYWGTRDSVATVRCLWHDTSNAWGLHDMGSTNSDTVRVGTATGGSFLDFTSALAGVAQGGTFHAVLTYNPTSDTIELFINGVSAGTNTGTVFQNPTGNFIVGGGSGSFSSSGATGNGDEVALYTSILSSGRILAHYNAGLGIFPGSYTGGDYTQDAGIASDLSISGGQVVPAGTMTSERRMTHTARGYTHLEHQETRKFTPGATITNFKGGCTLRRSAASTYVDVYVDDNGTNSRLRIDVVIAGARTNRSSTNLAARVVNGTAFWVRGRIEGQTVIAEYFTIASFPGGPTPMGTPTLSASYALIAGEQTSLVAGYGGFSWIPQDAAARLDDYESLPRTYRNQTLPGVLQMSDQVPGTGPALMDVTVTPSGGSAAPAWCMIAWVKRATTPVAGAVAPFGLIAAESGGSLSGWSVQADATYRGGSGLKVTTAGAGTFTASYGIDPSTLPADVFTDKELRIEVWARVDLASTLVAPTLKATVQPGAGLNFGPERQTLEWGTTGKQLVKPSSGSAKRQVLLGTLPLITEHALKWNLVITGTVAAGSTGTYGVDDLFLVARRQRALQASAKPNDATFPKFVASTSETSKTVRSNGQGRVSQPPNPPYPDAGLGGSAIEVPPGLLDVMTELSSLVPDDPTSDTTSEQLSHSATVHFAIVPRIFLFRGA